MSFPVSAMDNAQDFCPIDAATLAYVAIEAVLVAIFMSARQGWYIYLGLYVSAAALTLMITLMSYQGKIWRTIRLVYPLIIMSFLYEALNPQIFMIHSLPFDSRVNALEMAILGFDSSFALLPQMTVWRNEVMSLAYMSYYFLVPAAVFSMAFRGRWESLEKMALAACVTFYACYLIFIFFPVLGPRFYLGNIYYLPFDGPLFTPLVRKIVNAGGLYGGAMPSSHCGIALVVVWYMLKEFKKATLPFLTLIILLCVSTVYGRFHYLSDVIAGLLLAAAMLMITSVWHRRFTALHAEISQSREADIERVIEAGVEQ